MKISIDSAIFENFPNARIGWLVADVEVKPSDPLTDMMKKTLVGRLSDIGVSADTMKLHPDVARWREVYKQQGVKPSKYLCSLEALLKRTFKGDVWNVSNVVDCYDCISALNLLPMGAHDISKLKGGLTLRYGREGEKFYPLGAGDDVIDVAVSNVLYADDEKVCCWLWNYRDTRDAMVTDATKKALFLIDCAFETEWRTVEQGLEALANGLESIGCKVRAKGVVDAKEPATEIPA